jgi:hypothetical protein
MFHLLVKFLNSSHGSFESAFAKDNVLVYPRLNSLFPFADQNSRALASAMVRLMVIFVVNVQVPPFVG